MAELKNLKDFWRIWLGSYIVGEWLGFIQNLVIHRRIHSIQTDLYLTKKSIKDKITKKIQSTSLHQTNKRKSFIDILLDKYESNEISYKGILEEVDTFMFEGHDTTSSAMTFATTLLSQNSGYQKKAQEEIDAKLQKIKEIERQFNHSGTLST